MESEVHTRDALLGGLGRGLRERWRLRLRVRVAVPVLMRRVRNRRGQLRHLLRHVRVRYWRGLRRGAACLSHR